MPECIPQVGGSGFSMFHKTSTGLEQGFMAVLNVPVGVLGCRAYPSHTHTHTQEHASGFFRLGVRLGYSMVSDLGLLASNQVGFCVKFTSNSKPQMQHGTKKPRHMLCLSSQLNIRFAAAISSRAMPRFCAAGSMRRMASTS